MNRHALPGLLALEEEKARAVDGSPEAAEAPADASGEDAPEQAADADPD